MKLSLIIPVYNSEKYINNCLDSIVNQKKFEQIEVVIVNDKSTDNSKAIIDEYIKKYKNIKCIDLENNSGQSIARNIGVNNASGEYLFFMDSDDEINSSFIDCVLEKISKDTNIDLIRICNKVILENRILEDKSLEFDNLSGEQALNKMYKNQMWIETPWSYVISKNYWLKNNFKFAEGRLQEDLGIIPIAVSRAKNVCSINNAKYFYYIRENSTMTKKEYSHIYKIAYDVLYHYEYYVENTKEFNYKTNNILFSIMIRALINKIELLNKKDKKEYREEIKKRRVLKNIKVKTVRDFMKVIYYYFKLYIR